MALTPRSFDLFHCSSHTNEAMYLCHFLSVRLFALLLIGPCWFKGPLVRCFTSPFPLVYLSFRALFLSPSASVHPFFCLSVRLSICPSVCLSVCLSICLSLSLSICLSQLVSLSVRLFTKGNYVWLAEIPRLFVSEMTCRSL